MVLECLWSVLSLTESAVVVFIPYIVNWLTNFQYQQMYSSAIMYFTPN
jgi:hypothetical protein